MSEDKPKDESYWVHCIDKNGFVHPAKVDQDFKVRFMESKPMSEWIKTEDEYPPCDGYYYAKNKSMKSNCWLYFYNGYAFQNSDHLYVRDPIYWAHMPKREKQYGKRNK